ncbi:hypothetical protein TH53_17470 [Pedobacter lusitanus]|uniref:YD repeat-containing protein n=2 Tax=Pedobacter lusitanus TaxID=1503925 RepID=A0A0D0FU76_9SPHI|nr:hypothetical protein TH53_17470 [Pedobacter lusitanus]
MSGSFFFDHTGKWQVKSKQNLQLNIVDEVKNDYEVKNSGGRISKLRHTLTKFIITDMDGVRYTFGGNEDAIEFTRSPYVSDCIGCITADNSLLISNAWLLQKIESPKGIITFNYKREYSFADVYYSEIHRNERGQISPIVEETSDIDCTHRYINYSSYLNEIKTDDGTTISFDKSISNDLVIGQGVGGVPPRKVEIWESNNLVEAYNIYESLSDNPGNPRNYFKMDKIQVIDKNQTVTKEIDFDYIANPTERLKLSGVSFIGASSRIIEKRYDFQYNPQNLPDYCIGKIDHWGFSNGKHYPWPTGPINFPDMDKYYQSREPDSSFLQAEMLTKIIYPTKGTSEFVYEAHDYNKVVKQFPISIESLSNNLIAGGLRIKKIISTDGISNTPLVKEYYYINNYLNGGTVSSGVVSGLPSYYLVGNVFATPTVSYPYRVFSSNSLNNLNHTNGNHVTYTEVVEKIGDGGYTSYKYTNQDNGYMDKAPFYSKDGLTPRMAYLKSFGKLELERGLLLEKKYFTTDKSLLRRETTVYNSDPNRYEDYVRGLQVENRAGYLYGAIITFPFFTFTPYIEKNIVVDYTSEKDSIITSTSYEYGNLTHKQMTKSTTINSKGEAITTEYKYPQDFAYRRPYNNMLAQHIWRPLVEQNTYKTDISSGYINGLQIEYYNPRDGLFVPKTISMKVRSSDNSWQPKNQYHEYDKYGNILSQSNDKGSRTNYIWGYSGQRPIAKIENTNMTSSDIVMNTVYKRVMIPIGSTSASINFTSGTIADIKLEIDSEPGSTNTLQYVLSGSGTKSGNLCVSRSSQSCSYPSTVVFNNMPEGTYTLEASASAGSEGRVKSITIAYTEKQIPSPEFFYEGFEEVSDNVITGGAHSGNKYYNTDYRIPLSFTFTKGNNYIIQWWNYVDDKWNFNQQPYTPDILLKGPVDDIRIFPKDAKMTTYTYDSSGNITSQTDAKGNVTNYEYDEFQRLNSVKDQNGNILKNNTYNYKN